MAGVFISMSGAGSNMIVYLIKEYHVKSIDAAQINNIVNGCTSLTPVAGAIISDAFFGSYLVVLFSTFANFLAILLFTLTAAIQSLRPAPCVTGSTTCKPPSTAQLAVFYGAVALLSIGTGGTRFNLVTMGADQFDRVKDQDVFFNWFFVIMYGASIIGATVIVYVQDSVSWALGFGICAAVGSVSVGILMKGGKYYRRSKAQGSPFTGIARVIVAAIKKRKVRVGVEQVSYYYGNGVIPSIEASTTSLRFLNRAAMITASGETNPDSSIANPWSLCSIQQVEDLKILLKLVPLWTSSIFLSISIGILGSLTVLQALSMNRSLSPHFSLPAGSVIVFMLSTVALVLPLIDRILIPLSHRLTNRTPTPLQLVGLGHVFNTTAMAASALVERKRAASVIPNRAIVPMSVLWLVIQLVLVGLGEALHFPGQVALYYQEFPNALKNTATGMVALLVGIGFYGSTMVVDLVRKTTKWLPDNVNESKMDNVFWMLTVLGTVNFGYIMLCARLYKYQNRNI